MATGIAHFGRLASSPSAPAASNPENDVNANTTPAVTVVKDCPSVVKGWNDRLCPA